MDPVIPIIISGAAAAASIVSLVIAMRAHRIQRIEHLKGPELHVYFEQSRRGFGDLLILENVGDEALEMDVSVYVDPKEDDRYTENDSKPIWIFRRELHTHRPKRWMHSFQAVLAEMGYRQDCTYIVRLVGKFWPVASGKEFSRDYSQKYQVSLTSDGWLYVEQSDNDWYYADHRPKPDLKRMNIPKGLRKEDEHG